MKKASKKTIYLDNASATPADPAVIAAMEPYFGRIYGNPSSLHALGVQARSAVESARERVARVLGAHADEIFFTSGGTESDNLAILGAVEGYVGKAKPHIVTTNIEHSAVLETCRALESSGRATVTYVPVEENGIVDPKKIKKALKKNTILVSVMYANNEIGTIQPIREIAKTIRHFKKSRDAQYPLFHTDAAQAMNYLDVAVERLGVDLLSFSGSKIYGPKGVGALFKKRNIPLARINQGGDQESGLRPGTENVAGIIGVATALEIAEKMKAREAKRLTAIRDQFFAKLVRAFPNIVINGDPLLRLPNNINISVPDISSELLVIALDAYGICASAKSACHSGDDSASYVVGALRSSKENEITGSVRFSLGRTTKKSDVTEVTSALVEIMHRQNRLP